MPFSIYKLSKLFLVLFTSFLALLTVVGPVSTILNITSQAADSSAINNPEAFLITSGKINSDNSVNSFTDYSYLDKLPNYTDYAVSGIGINVNKVLKG